MDKEKNDAEARKRQELADHLQFCLDNDIPPPIDLVTFSEVDKYLYDGKETVSWFCRALQPPLNPLNRDSGDATRSFNHQVPHFSRELPRKGRKKLDNGNAPKQFSRKLPKK